MASDKTIDEVMRRVNAGIRHIMEQTGEDAAKDLKQSLSVPVGRGPGGEENPKCAGPVPAGG